MSTFDDLDFEPAPTLHEELRALLDAPEGIAQADLVAVLRRHPAPGPVEAFDASRMVIKDGYLLYTHDGCTCVAAGLDGPYASCHEAGCGYEPLQDLTETLARSGYVHAGDTRG